MTVHTHESEHGGHGPLSAAISTATVQLVREYTGRGPTKAHTTIRDSIVLVMLEDTLTQGERALVAHGQADLVITMRTEFQNAMRQAAAETIGRLTGRTVIAMMSANHISPDLGAELFVLDAPPVLAPA